MARNNITVTLIKFSLPLILSGILQQLYSWADAFIVGHVNGETALAAVGATAAITDFFVLSITGFTLGLSIFAAQKHGQQHTEEISKILSSFSLLLGVVFTGLAALGIPFTAPILNLMNTPTDMFSLAKDYLRIIFIGIPVLAVYNTYASLLRAMGDSKAPFYAVLISSTMNVLLDILLVAILPFGVAGAATATVISQIAMTIFIVCYATKKYSSMRYSIRGKLLHLSTIRQGCKFGFPPAIQSSVTSLGNIALQNFMNGFGSQTVAAVTTAYRIDSIMLLPVVNLGSAISTLAAQSKGANEHWKIKKLLQTGIVIVILISLTLSVIMPLFGGRLIAMFGVEEAATKIGSSFFQSISVFYLFYGIATAFRGTVEGIGNVVYSSVVGIATLCVRIALSYLLASSLANMAIAYAEGLSWIFMTLTYIPNLILYRKEIMRMS
ncbi:MAG: MATE family efflux transporter [Enterocloster asparagiformis]|nr:MATE family efflux transporter [Enterocloster asparagiformis]